MVAPSGPNDFEFASPLVWDFSPSGLLLPYLGVSLFGGDGRPNSVIVRQVQFTSGQHLLLPAVYAAADCLCVPLPRESMPVLVGEGVSLSHSRVKARFAPVRMTLEGSGEAEAHWCAWVGFCKEFDDLGYAEIGVGFLEEWFLMNGRKEPDALRLTRRFPGQMQLHRFTDKPKDSRHRAGAEGGPPAAGS